MNIIPLNLISSYSFLESSIKIEPLFIELNKNKIDTCGVADLNVLYSYPYFYKYSKQYNIKPLYGMNIHVNDNELVLYIINENGYKNLIKLSFLYSKNNNLTIDELKNYSKDLYCIINNKRSKIFKNSDEHEKAKYLSNLDIIFDHNFLIGLEAYSFDDEDLISTRSFIKKHPFDVIAFPMIKYIKKEDAIKLLIEENIKNNKHLDCEQNSTSTGNFYLRNEKEINEIYNEYEILNTHNLALKLNFNYNQKRGKMLLFSSSTSSYEELKKKCFDGLKSKNIETTTYIERLNYELNVIHDMGYDDYFLIVADYVNFAKNNNIYVGPGRGSAAGSLVSYCLNITEIDPLKYNLLFERFLNKDRQTMPDIDVDFEDTKRNIVVSYLINEYGINRVSSIATIQEIKARQSIRDVGRVYDLYTDSIDKLTKKLTNPKYSLMESYNKDLSFREYINNADLDSQKAFKLALKIENLPRQQGLHAAGVVLNNENILDSLPCIYDSSLNMLVSQYEMTNLEDQGFLKMDLLGLTNLSTIHFIIDLIKINHNVDIKFSEINIFDERIYKEIISTNLTMGVFQLESNGMNNAISIIKPQCFNDVVSLLALFRPGPMDNIKEFAKRKNNPNSIKYDNEIIKEILSETYGVIIYQEQIMQICSRIAGFSYAEADIFRRAISKKHVDEMMKFKEKFIKGCMLNKYNQTYANNLYETILKFANYGFNKSHSVAYAMITARMAWLKLYYPNEFYIALLGANVGANNYKFNEFLKELEIRNIKIDLPNINLSSYNFVSYNNKMIMPFTAIKGLNSDSIEKIIYIRNKENSFNGLYDFIKKCYQNDFKISQSQLEKLIKSGCFDSFNQNRESMLNKLETILKSMQLFIKANLFELNDDENIEYDLSIKEDYLKKLKDEKDLLGICISSNLVGLYKNRYEDYKITLINNLKLNIDSNILVGLNKKAKILTTKKGDKMAFLDVYDENNSNLEVVVFPTAYKDNYQKFEDENNIILIKGRLENRNDKISFIANEIILKEKDYE